MNLSKTISLISLTVYSVLAYVFLEWLFFVTKPSFLTACSLPESLLIAIITPIYLLPVPIIFQIAVVALLGTIPSLRKSSVILQLCLAIPSAILGMTIYLIINNFTHTVLGWSVVSHVGIERVLFAIILISLCAWTFLNFSQFIERRVATLSSRTLALTTCTIISISLGTALYRHTNSNVTRLTLPSINSKDIRKPNILIISSDALNANRFSFYGYERNTTPFLDSLTPKLLIAENAFANVNRSAGSLISVLTGKSLQHTRVITSPDRVPGDQSYEHLPGILGLLGYSRYEFSVRRSADSFDSNLRNVFDYANDRRLDTSFARWIAGVGDVYTSDAFYFTLLILDRARDILLHTFGVITLPDTFHQMTRGGHHYKQDRTTVDKIVDIIRHETKPLFIHAHLLGTHGPYYATKHKAFSRGKQQQRSYDNDFYDDAILDFDLFINDLFNALSETGKLRNSLIVVHSDHSKQYRNHHRIPLMFYFPDGAHSGARKENAQLLDIAPTIIDFMGISVPTWMEGISLLSAQAEEPRPIFTYADHYPDSLRFERFPPFYGVARAALIVCHQAFVLETQTDQLETLEISDHTATCSEDLLPTEQEARNMITQQLKKF